MDRSFPEPVHIVGTIQILGIKQILACLLLAFGAVTTVSASAQSAGKLHRIGVFSAIEMCPAPKVFLDNLKTLGWVDGRNVVIDCVSASDHLPELPVLALELVNRRPDVVVTGTTMTIRALMTAARKIPIIMMGSGYPADESIIDSLGRAEGNEAGLAARLVEAQAARLNLLKEVVPNLSRLAVISQGGMDPRYAAQSEEAIRLAVAKLGLSYELFSPARSEDFAPLFKRLAAENFDGAILLALPLNVANQALIGRLSSEEGVPTIGGRTPAFVEAGGLLSYGLNIDYSARRAAQYVDYILRGKHPALLPVERPPEFELRINLSTARSLGLSVSPALLGRATEVFD